MKILFLLGATSRIRNFRHTLVLLADRGHEITLAGRPRKGSFELPKGVTHRRISGRVNPTERSDEWRDFVGLLRGARDYARYFDPRYAGATRLLRRAYEVSPTEFVLFCERHQWLKRHWRITASLLALCEALIPTDPDIEAFVREEQPDVVLVTPLVTFWDAYQTDYLKVAHRLGIPVVFIPFSWDNLTNKGLMRVRPDRVLVWNDIQGREAIDLHGCRADTIRVTGAARFDDFYRMRPSTARAEFLMKYGLDPARPMVLYLGSSQLTGPNEMELVRRWTESLRAADEEIVRTCAVLIRPHPAVRSSWASVDFSGFGDVAVSLQDGARNADQELFDSLAHAHAVVGLNTSAMLEAAIVGRPVYTLLIPGFDQGQVGTIHFRYLVEAYGGLAVCARSFAEHQGQLLTALRQQPSAWPRSRAFADQFLRPLGGDQPVSPILAAEIERAASIVKRPRTMNVAHTPLRRALHAWLRRRAAQAGPTVDSTVIGTLPPLRPVRTTLEEIQHGTHPVFVGPWLDSIGNELLYWIPFVRWVASTYELPPERLIALSCSSAGEWYGSLAGGWRDIRTLLSPAELERWRSGTVPQCEQDPKQTVLPAFDRNVLERAARACAVSSYHVLHPFLLFRVLARLRGDSALDRLGELLRHETLPPSARRSIDGLPSSFVAASVGFTPTLPPTEDNRRFLTELVNEVAAEHQVVIVDSPLPRDVELPRSDRVHLLDGAVTDADTGDRQMRTLAQASAFVGGYGDLSILAAYCGTPATVYHSEPLPPDLGERLEAATAAGWGSVSTKPVRALPELRLPQERRA